MTTPPAGIVAALLASQPAAGGAAGVASIRSASSPSLSPDGPVTEAEQITARLKARGVPVEDVLFPDEGHGWRRLPDRVRSTETLADVFQRRLAPAAG